MAVRLSQMKTVIGHIKVIETSSENVLVLFARLTPIKKIWPDVSDLVRTDSLTGILKKQSTPRLILLLKPEALRALNSPFFFSLSLLLGSQFEEPVLCDQCCLCVHPQSTSKHALQRGLCWNHKKVPCVPHVLYS